MPYTRLLNQLIDDSGLTAKEIAERCTEQGQAITASYVSILRKEANERTPSVEVSQALEKVLKAPEDILVLEAYLDNAPEVLMQVLRTALQRILEFTFRAIDGAMPIGEVEKEAMEAQIEQMPLSHLVFSLREQLTQSFFEQNILASSEMIDETQLNVSMQANVDFDIPDSAMQPLLPEGSKAKLKFQMEFQSGEVVAVISLADKNMIFRKLYDTKDGKRMLMPLNPAFDVMEFDSASMLIFGRVEAVVTQL